MTCLDMCQRRLMCSKHLSRGSGYWTTRGCHRRLCVLSFRSFGGICETASCPVRDLSIVRELAICKLAYPRVVQLPGQHRHSADVEWIGVDIGTTWRIPLNRPCAAMRPSVKLLWPFVNVRHFLRFDFLILPTFFILTRSQNSMRISTTALCRKQ